ncbi:uncharacterized protein LOC114753107 [Neltuma alba]|uniref:uncharacterized protein LOC114753107 n=1 Tax=Neltuma alba TaxID=207710 RepID=UPI0010A4ED5F|nr:uncharacterized protein LOC114753107 [Prosopis alba]
MNTLTQSTAEDSKVERGRYTRICVELDLQKRLVPRVMAANRLFHVEYEGLNLICFACGRYGHKKESCSWSYVEPTQNNKPSSSSVPVPEKKSPVVEEEFGAWMIARGNRARNLKKEELKISRINQEKGQKYIRQSRSSGLQTSFEVLANMEEHDLMSEEFTDGGKASSEPMISGDHNQTPNGERRSGAGQGATTRVAKKRESKREVQKEAPSVGFKGNENRGSKINGQKNMGKAQTNAGQTEKRLEGGKQNQAKGPHTVRTSGQAIVAEDNGNIQNAQPITTPYCSRNVSDDPETEIGNLAGKTEIEGPFVVNKRNEDQIVEEPPEPTWIDGEIDVLCLLETRISGERADNVVRHLGFNNWLRLEATGFAGGIWVLWDESQCTINYICSTTQLIHCQITNKDTGEDFLTTFVYGEPSRIRRASLWASIKEIADSVSKA